MKRDRKKVTVKNRDGETVRQAASRQSEVRFDEVSRYDFVIKWSNPRNGEI